MSTSFLSTARNARNRIYCALFTLMLMVGNVFAADDPADFDPDGNLTVLGVLGRLWDFLNSIFA